MITITDAAAAKIKELMPQQNDAEYGLRMRVLAGGCSGLQYQMDLDSAPGATDKVYEVNGIKVLIDVKSAQHLQGVRIDYMNSLMESGFKITNPNALTTCGCGQSFR